MDELVECIIHELKLKSEAGREGTLGTLYLGGGTPSLLTPKHLDKILSAVHQYFSFRKDPEITLECNPDDLNKETLHFLYRSGINRLSIGVQSFQQRDLELMRRSHTTEQAIQAVFEAAEAGFANLTIDLIYGVPGQTSKEWELTLKQAISLPVTHLSAYHLTFEPGTVFDHWRSKGRITEVSEELSIAQYKLLRQLTGAEGFDHYEISNFAREGNYSRHNLLYWSGEPYLGVGPSAHSFHGTKRSWNIASLKKYMESIAQGDFFSESETLTTTEQYHDALITKLRTRWGVDPFSLEERFGLKYRQLFDQRTAPFLDQGIMLKNSNMVAIHPDHWLIADHIFRELFLDPEGEPIH